MQDRILRRTQLYQHNSSIMNSAVPMFLQFENLLPDSQGDEVCFVPEQLQMLFHVDFAFREEVRIKLGLVV